MGNVFDAMRKKSAEVPSNSVSQAAAKAQADEQMKLAADAAAKAAAEMAAAAQALREGTSTSAASAEHAPAQTTQTAEQPAAQAPAAKAAAHPATLEGRGKSPAERARLSIGKVVSIAPTQPKRVIGPKKTLDPAAVNYSPLIVSHCDPSSRISEQYRSLRAHLLARAKSGRLCMMITSAEPGEGKTVTSLNLAIVLAGRQEQRTIVLDCDFRRRRMATLLRAESTPGLADVLRGQASIEEVIQPTCYPNLFFIPAGDTDGHTASEMLNRPQMQDILGQLRRSYDYVLLDTPPVNAVSDASSLGESVCEALLVVRMNRTRRESITKALGVLRAINVKVCGMVLTHQDKFIPQYIYKTA